MTKLNLPHWTPSCWPFTLKKNIEKDGREVNFDKNLLNFPKNKSIFIDVNIFHLYLRGPKKIQEICKNLLEKIERKEIIGYTSPLVLDELAYNYYLRKLKRNFKKIL